MKRFLALVRLLFVQQYRVRLASNETKKKRVGVIIAFVALGIVFLPFLLGVATAMYYMGNMSNGNVYVGSFLILMCQGLVLMFGVHAIISNVFTAKDADKLTYLPVHSTTIFVAKLTVAYINEVITTAVTILLVLLPFGIGSSASIAYYIMLVFGLFLIPLLPMLLSCLVSMPLAALIAKIGKNSAVKTILRIFVYILIMGIYLYAMYSLGFLAGSEGENILDNPELVIGEMLEGFVARLEKVIVYLHPNYMLMYSMTATSFGAWAIGFVATVGENLGLLALVVLVAMPFYKWMLRASMESGSGSRKKNIAQYKVQNNGVVKELMLSDFKRTVRDSQLGFQSFAGVIMMPIIVLILYFFMGASGDENVSLLEIISSSSLSQVIAPLVIMAYMMLIGVATNILGLYPISRENKSVYMLKSLPVAFNKILLAKVLLATAVMLLSDFFTCVLIVALLGVKWYYGVAMLVAMALIGFGAMCITTLLDLKSPKLGWSNFNQNLKNAKNSWIAMLIAMLATIAVAAVSFGFVIWYGLTEAWYVALMMWLIIFGFSAGFAAISYKIMTGKAAKYFEQIEI